MSNKRRSNEVLIAWADMLRRISAKAAIAGFCLGVVVLLDILLRKGGHDSSDAYILIFLPMGIAMVSMYASVILFGAATGEDLRKMRSTNQSTDGAVDR